MTVGELKRKIADLPDDMLVKVKSWVNDCDEWYDDDIEDTKVDEWKEHSCLFILPDGWEDYWKWYTR